MGGKAQIWGKGPRRNLAPNLRFPWTRPTLESVQLSPSGKLADAALLCTVPCTESSSSRMAAGSEGSLSYLRQVKFPSKDRPPCPV